MLPPYLCELIDNTIERYKRLRNQTTDKPAVEAADKLVAELQAKKAALHPE
jgi:hypothetical protein